MGDLYSVGNVSLSNEIFSKMIKWGMVNEHWESGFLILTLCPALYAHNCHKNIYIRLVIPVYSGSATHSYKNNYAPNLLRA